MLTAPKEKFAPEKGARKRPTLVPERVLRRDLAQDFAPSAGELEGGYHRRRKAGVRLTFPGGIPRSAWGRIAAALTVLLCAGVLVGIGLAIQQWVLHDHRFYLEGADAIEITGNAHMGRADLLAAFDTDIGRNIFHLPLEERKAAIEAMPWVKRATVMRLLPNHVRVQITERTPVAFVRNGSTVGLVDASGELLDTPKSQTKDGAGSTEYSFPVVTGILPQDPSSTREARMHIFQGFMTDLSALGEPITNKLSEVDLSNPEDVKALIPDDGKEVLVHFGDRDFLDRYHKYEEHLPEWRAQYPKLASVDMRYERQVVLEMQPGSPVPIAGVAGAEAAATGGVKPATSAGKAATSSARASVIARPASHPVTTATASASHSTPKPVHTVATAKASPHTAPGAATHKPQLVGFWTKDGKYHAPPAGAKR